MAKYTLSIMEILQDKANGNLADPQVLYNAAMQTLFNQNELNVISSEYREFFAKAFARHYFIDEIGVETYPLWKILLAGRIYENATAINGLLENQDKQIYSQYSVHISDMTSHGEDSSESQTESSGNDRTNSQHTDTSTAEGTDTTAYTGSRQNKRTGDDTTAISGSESRQHSGQDTLTHAGSEETQYGRTETAGQYDTTAFSNTPQGSLKDVENGTYLTNYTKNTTGGTNKSGGSDRLTYEGRTDTNGYNSTETTSYNGRNDKTTYNTTETESFTGRQDQTTHSNTDTSNSSDDTTTNRTGSSTTNASGENSNESHTNDVNYTLLLDQLASGSVIMDSIWSMFTDLFMAIG